MDMICDSCGRYGIEWKGRWSNLTHTECPHCGGINCQRVELEEEEISEDCPTCPVCFTDHGMCDCCY